MNLYSTCKCTLHWRLQRVHVNIRVLLCDWYIYFYSLQCNKCYVMFFVVQCASLEEDAIKAYSEKEVNICTIINCVPFF